MAGNRTVKVVIAGDASGGQQAMKSLDAAGDTSVTKASQASGKISESLGGIGEKIGNGFSKLGSTIGGEVGELVGRVGEGFDQISEHGTSALSKLAIGGGVMAGLGVAMQAFASKGQAAENQLKAAVDASGASWDDYESKVSKAIDKEAKYAHDSADTVSAIQTLYQKTQDMDVALGDLNVTTDLAAVKRESLTAAAAQIAAIYSGSTKVLKQYGIAIQANADGTKNFQGAVDALGQKLSGQADAQANTFTGKVAGIKTEIQNAGEKVAAFIGGPLTLLGTVTSAVTGVMEISATAIAVLRARHAENTVATLADSTAQGRLAATAELAAVAEGELAVATGGQAAAARGSMLASSLALGGLAALAAGAYFGGNAIAHLVDNNKALNENVFNSTKIVGTLTDALKQGGDAGERAAQQFVLTSLQSDGLADKANAAGIGLDKLTQAVTGTDAQTESLIRTWQKSGNPSSATLAALVALHNEYKGSTADAAKYIAAQDALNAANTKQGFTLDTTSKAYQQATTEAQGYAKAVGEVENKTIDLTKGQYQYLDSLDALTAAVKQNGTSLDANTTKGRANREAIMTSIGAINDQAKAQLANGSSIGAVNTVLQSNENKLRASATAAGLNKSRVNAMIAQMALIPSKLETKILVDDQAAMDALNGVEDKLNYLGGLAHTDAGAFLTLSSHLGVGDVNGVGSGGTSASADRQIAAAKPHAAGGFGSGLSVVGEQGWEYVNLPKDSNVFTHAQSMAMASAASRGSDGSSAGSNEVPIQINVYTDGARTHTSLLKLKRERGVASLNL